MKSVVVCGSQRFKDEIRQFVDDLKKLGVHVVFEPNFEGQSTDFAKKEEKERLELCVLMRQTQTRLYPFRVPVRPTDSCGKMLLPALPNTAVSSAMIATFPLTKKEGDISLPH